MQNPVFVELVNSLGGNGIQVSFSELYTALQTGVVDGAENNPPTLYNHKHYEIANYYSLTHHLIVPEIFVFSKKVWDDAFSAGPAAHPQGFRPRRSRKERELVGGKGERTTSRTWRRLASKINEVADIGSVHQGDPGRS